jgi:4a-hydroxytetrahydrobiopterin dehydratase
MTTGAKIDQPAKAERIQALLREQRGWEYDPERGAIRRTYQFPSFAAAIRFVGFVAQLAEDADHHPDIDVRYNRVTLTLSTHSAGGVTEKDFALARQIDLS